MNRTASCMHTVVHIKALLCSNAIGKYPLICEVFVCVCYTGKRNFMRTLVEATISDSKTIYTYACF